MYVKGKIIALVKYIDISYKKSKKLKYTLFCTFLLFYGIEKYN